MAFRRRIAVAVRLYSYYSMPGGKFKQLFEHSDNVISVCEKADFTVFAKPPGMETISQDGNADLTGLVRRQRREPGLVPVHRLDRDTSGAQLFARTPEAEAALTALFRHRRIEKTYLAFCLGVPRNLTGTINRNLSEWSGGRRPVRIVKKGGLTASTSYRMLAASAELPGETRISLLAFVPHQGRTHQIRVHASGFGYPILGDDQYGDRAANKVARALWGLRRQALHSWRLGFAWRSEKIAIACPLFTDMCALLERVFADAIPNLPADIIAGNR